MLLFPYPTKDLARIEVQRDPVCARMREAEQSALIDGAWGFGRVAGRTWLPAGEASAAAWEVAVQEVGARVRHDDRGLAAWGGFVGEYDPSTATIVLHERALRQWEEETGIDRTAARRIALAHEFFHHLDCSGRVLPWSSVRMPDRRLTRLIPSRGRPRGVLEACAHGFASIALDPGEAG